MAWKRNAMFSERPYHPARTFEEVHREIMRCSGTQFDPTVVAAYARMTEKVERSFFKNSAAAIHPSLMIPHVLSGNPNISPMQKSALIGIEMK
jgi:hypothetical protein